jgi:peptidoglycan/LPS O-acetylase OafA/YrhL
MSDRGRAFVTLDGLRGVAALAIAARHAPFLWGPKEYPQNLFFESYLAVDFFFVLSGFVLAHAYGDALRDGMSPRQFMTLRLMRLYPLYFLAFLISLFVTVGKCMDGTMTGRDGVINALFAGVFLPSPFSGDKLFPLNAPAWSLFLELVANLAFCLLGKRAATSPKGAELFAFGVVLTLACALGWFGFGQLAGAMNTGVTWSTLGAGLTRVAFSFSAGMFVHRFWRHPVFARLNVQPLLVVIPLCLVLLSYPPAKYGVAYDLAATLIVFPAIVLLGAHSMPGPRAARLFGWLGAISYAIYVLQTPIFEGAGHVLGRAVVAFLDHHGLEALLPLWGATSVALLVLIADAACRYFDQPVRRNLAEWLKETRRPASTETAALRR